MRRWFFFLVLVGLVAPWTVLAQDSFKNVEYVAGKEGYEKKVKGVLHLEDTQLRFTDKKGRAVFEIPLKHVKEVEASKEREEGSFGRKLALGIFASKNQEYLYIDTETDEAAEVVVFKCKKKTTDGIAAKINFQLNKLKETEN